MNDLLDSLKYAIKTMKEYQKEKTPIFPHANFAQVLPVIGLEGKPCEGYASKCSNKAYTKTVSMTCYPDEPGYYWLCPVCSEEYQQYWEERWRELEGGYL